jgi:polyhydroxyalkanoate synthesis regulator phasin
MADLNNLIEYLRPLRKLNSDAKEAARSTTVQIIDENYRRTNTQLNFNYEVKDLEFDSDHNVLRINNINNSSYLEPYKSSFYIAVLNNRGEKDSIKYYYRKPNRLNTGFLYYAFGRSVSEIIPEGIDVISVNFETSVTYYYNASINRIVLALSKIDAVFLMTGSSLFYSFDPVKLKSYNEGDGYIINYKDVIGYDTSFIDQSSLFLQGLATTLVTYDSSSGMEYAMQREKRKGTIDKIGTKVKTMYAFPKLSKKGQRFVLEYVYTNKAVEEADVARAYKNDDTLDIAVSLSFISIGAFLEYFKQSILRDVPIKAFKDYGLLAKTLSIQFHTLMESELKFRSSDFNSVLAMIYYLPDSYLVGLHNSYLWQIVTTMLKNNVNNIGVNTEDIAIRLLTTLAEKYENKTNFLIKLLEPVAGKTSNFHKLYEKLNGSDFVFFINFIHKIWLISDFVNPNNSIYKDNNSPLALNYESDKTIGIFHSNFDTRWRDDQLLEFKPDNGWWEEIITAIVPTAGTVVRLNDIEGNGDPFIYHPLQPIIIANVSDQKTGIELTHPLMPAVMLRAAEDKAYWSNVITTAEYAVDIASTFTGIGSILKAGRLLKVLNSGHKLVYKTKNVTRAITAAKAAVGFIEVTSGAVNALLKLSGSTDTAFGRAISEYLFYLELLSLSGELTVALRGALKKSALNILEVGPDGTRAGRQLENKLDDLVKKGELDEAGKAKVVDEVAEFAEEGISYNSKKYARKVSSALDKAPQSVKDFEKIHRKSKVESLLIHNIKSSKTNFWTSNLKGSVFLPDDFIPLSFRNIISHNHPLSSGFSIKDITNFFQLNLKELRAVTPDGEVFSLTGRKLTAVDRKILLDNIKEISLKHSKTNGSRQAEFDEIYDIINDKISYIQYTN